MTLDDYAWFDGVLATDLVDTTDDPAALDGPGWWAVVATFDGDFTFARFATVRRLSAPPGGPWVGPDRSSWASSLTRADYLTAVERIRSAVAVGRVYQVTLCRILSAPVPEQADPMALAALLHHRHRAPYGGAIRLARRAMGVVTASPECYLAREGREVRSGPIKGTAAPGAPFLEKDVAENVMIVDLVRNDLGAVAVPGGVRVEALCVREELPGLAHLVSTVRAELDDGTGWGPLLAASFPPGSVSGAPKSTALQVIDELEPQARGPYCGAVGWIDGDRGDGRLAVGIRTFWWDDGLLRFGTGAGITWASDPAAEWAETELKAERLLSVVSR
jgi:para-aminobenzoate synthetase component 1